METSLAFSPFRLLPTLDELRLVVDALDEDDAFAFACACTPFRAATCLADGPFARFKDGVRTNKRAMWTSARRLEWARSMGYEWNDLSMEKAAGAGHLEAMQWARANGCLWGECTCSFAADGGQLAVLQWARANGCPWDWFTCAFAARGGHLAVLQWARRNGCPWNAATCAFAAGGGHLPVLPNAKRLRKQKNTL